MGVGGNVIVSLWVMLAICGVATSTACWITDARSTSSVRSAIFSSTDTADVKQVVDHTNHVTDLPFHYFECRVEQLTVAATESHDLKNVPDGRQWVAQFVCQ